jgi:hypothetical protein
MASLAFAFVANVFFLCTIRSRARVCAQQNDATLTTTRCFTNDGRFTDRIGHTIGHMRLTHCSQPHRSLQNSGGGGGGRSIHAPHVVRIAVRVALLLLGQLCVRLGLAKRLSEVLVGTQRLGKVNDRVDVRGQQLIE